MSSSYKDARSQMEEIITCEESLMTQGRRMILGSKAHRPIIMCFTKTLTVHSYNFCLYVKLHDFLCQ